ncbi:hypothetical protein BH09ACT1_BH09ACT1_19840 [soil metagenome]
MARGGKGSWLRSRGAIAAGVVLFLVLAGTGAATAVWTANGGTLTGSTTPGNLSITQTGFTNLANVYSSSNLADTAPLTISNDGNIPASYTMLVKATSANNLANATTVQAWIVSSAAACTSTTTVGTGLNASAGTGITATVSIPADDVDVYCIRTSITSSYAAANSTGSDTLRATLTSAVGNWTSNSTADAAQSLADGIAPTVPTNLTAASSTTTTVSLTWTASTDAVGVTGYRIYRNGTLVTTTAATATSYTNTGLTKGTSYSYTISAIDAAGNASAQSAAVVTITPVLTAGVKYKFVNANSGLCLDAGTTAANANPLQIYTCNTSRVQNWMVLGTTAGNFKIYPNTSTAVGWSIVSSSTANFAAATTATYSSLSSQQWSAIAESATTVHFVNLNSGMCLDINGQSKTSGTQLQQYDCNGSVAQSFTYSVVN